MDGSSLLSSSPSVSPIRLSEYLLDLLHFTLSLSLQEESDFQCSLPKEFCVHLLENAPENSCFCLHSHDGYQSSDTCDCVCHGDVADAVEKGVPVYPLYRQLASTLYNCITRGSFARKDTSMPGISEEEISILKVDEWMRTIINVGSQLTEVLQSAKFHLHVQEPFFTQLRNGQKTVEGRCAVGDYKRILPGDLLLINKCLLLSVQAVNCYGSFYEMIEAEGLKNVLPSIGTLEEGELVYRRFYTPEKEKIGGVLAIVVSRAPLQPYIILCNILTELHLEGVRALLGLRYTAGTISDALPPPRSVLMSSFSALNNVNVQGNKLTVGARALAKHVHRSSDGWWGSFTGKEDDKNKSALEIISHMISHAQWMNIHHVSPSNRVFEIRVKEGFGARWSENGAMFIGFLEPQMEDGHSKGWRH